MYFGKYKIKKTEYQQNIKLNTISATTYNKPSVLPMNKIDSQDKDHDIADGYRLKISINPEHWN